MSFVTNLVAHLSQNARKRRAAIFQSYFQFEAETKILDLGSENGSNIARILANTAVAPHNVFVADIDESFVNEGHKKFGFTPIVISENGNLPFPDKFFDIVYCSSVLEHVTIPKHEVWNLSSNHLFKEKAWRKQKEFAREIRRVAKSYFVQTPNRWFVIESHSWLPFVGWMPRPAQIKLLKLSNQVWVKKTAPDWRLLTRRELGELFPEAQILDEKFALMTKSLMAVKK